MSLITISTPCSPYIQDTGGKTTAFITYSLTGLSASEKHQMIQAGFLAPKANEKTFSFGHVPLTSM